MQPSSVTNSMVSLLKCRAKRLTPLAPTLGKGKMQGPVFLVLSIAISLSAIRSAKAGRAVAKQARLDVLVFCCLAKRMRKFAVTVSHSSRPGFRSLWGTPVAKSNPRNACWFNHSFLPVVT